MSSDTASSNTAEHVRGGTDLHQEDQRSPSPVHPLPDPPSYSATMSMSAEGNYGFPSGYFVIRSVATGRVFDIELDDVNDGAEVILWPEKENSLVEGMY